MPRKFKGGKKKSRGKRFRPAKKGSIVFKDDSVDGSQLYGSVVKRLGGRPAYVLVLCEDGVERRCVIRGKFTKKVWLNPNDIVLINYNKHNDDLKGEIEVKYSPLEINKLKRLGALDNVFDEQNEDDLNIIFGEDERKEIKKETYDDDYQINEDFDDGSLFDENAFNIDDI